MSSKMIPLLLHSAARLAPGYPPPNEYGQTLVHIPSVYGYVRLTEVITEDFAEHPPYWLDDVPCK